MNPLRRRLGVITLLVGALLAQVAFFPSFRFFGVMPDVMLVSTVAVAAREGADTGAVFGFVAGVLVDLFLEVPVGLSALTFVLVGYGIGAARAGFIREKWWLAPVLTGIASFGGGLLFVFSAMILGQEFLFSLRTFVAIPIRALYDAGLSLVMFPLTAKLLGPTADELAPYGS